jgi:hypothetical protein
MEHHDTFSYYYFYVLSLVNLDLTVLLSQCYVQCNLVFLSHFDIKSLV